MHLQMDKKFLECIEDDTLLSAMLSQLGKEYPEVVRALLHDRNWSLAIQLWTAAQTSLKPAVAVVGSAHLQGVVYVLCYLSIIAARVAMESQAQRWGPDGGADTLEEGRVGEEGQVQ
jgi:pheromone shutdown protein TraB